MRGCLHWRWGEMVDWGRRCGEAAENGAELRLVVQHWSGRQLSGSAIMQRQSRVVCGSDGLPGLCFSVVQGLPSCACTLCAAHVSGT